MFAIGKPNAVSMINGMITGLVAITPAAGYVDGFGAMAVGIVGGGISWFSLNRLGKMASSSGSTIRWAYSIRTAWRVWSAA